MKHLFITCISIFIIVSCKSNQKENTTHTGENIFKYAKHIYSKPGSNSFTIYYTWNGIKDSIVYSLSANKTHKVNEITTPISNVAVISTTDIAMIQAINEILSITGISDSARITNTVIKKRIQEKLVKDLGVGIEMNTEKLLHLKPSIIITTAYNNADIHKNTILNQSQIPIIYTMSWQESSPLARAEWIKLFGLLYNKQEITDSLFNKIENNYNKLASVTKNITHKPTILAGECYKDIWYMPGGASYVAQFIRDAGGTFVWNANNETGSIPINIEQVIQKTPKDAIWIGSDAESYKDLLRTNHLYSLLSVYSNKQIYNRNKKKNSQGANDYWESGFIRPDIVLADFISIIHPELLPNRELEYFQKLPD